MFKPVTTDTSPPGHMRSAREWLIAAPHLGAAPSEWIKFIERIQNDAFGCGVISYQKVENAGEN